MRIVVALLLLFATRCRATGDRNLVLTRIKGWLNLRVCVSSEGVWGGGDKAVGALRSSGEF
jgi:hypothetical protein